MAERMDMQVAMVMTTHQVLLSIVHASALLRNLLFIETFPSLRAKRGNLILWNQLFGDCFVTLFLAMTDISELPC